MTYKEYIEDTFKNCMTVLSECPVGDLLDANHLRNLLWEDDRVTGVVSGFCTSVKNNVADNIKDVLFDPDFLKDLNARGMNMQNVMFNGPDAIDVAARCLALKHISINELVKREQERRRHEREKMACEFFERT
ncbi:MAG: hypothetical protein IJ819_11695 [Clostridiales bacterium]|nr:hypothetical protein [Clostridiales bacterium]